jgi:DNA polymerase-3 subunit alpha
MASYSPFVPLRIYSSFTMLDGAIDPKAIAKLAKTRGFPAIAITDKQRTLRSACLFQRLQGRGRAADRRHDAGDRPARGEQCLRRLWPGRADDRLAGLLAQNEAGWLNLCHLVSRRIWSARWNMSRMCRSPRWRATPMA